jgi:hypothetical protein
VLWLRVTAWTFAVLAVLFESISMYGRSRWEAATRALLARLEAARRGVASGRLAASEVEGLPRPVQRYFCAALADRQPLLAAVNFEHSGSFNVGESTDRWKSFRSSQRVITQRPGFVWDATVAMAPGLPLRVHDAYVAGQGFLRPSIMGLIDLADLHGGDEIAEGELMRFLAEAAWYPTALLPSQGVSWEAVDDHAAKATLRDRGLSVTLLFRFGEDGLINSVRAEARGRLVAGKSVPTPWEARVWNYAVRNGMRVPIDGEVAWLLPEGRKPYWRGHITRVEFEYAG